MQRPRPSISDKEEGPWFKSRQARSARDQASGRIQHPELTVGDGRSLGGHASTSRQLGEWCDCPGADLLPNRIYARLVSTLYIRSGRGLACGRPGWNQVAVRKRPIRRRVIRLPPVITHKLGRRAG